ncbi:hypothetical protein [Ramlibacter alkalitolerans]|uniref:Uncharacterized protein n=1 Tax=Ramlibacter alkalitolerans TaxID=2039631 RepID=A0ABS1JQR9_9BURK|nr:hypothetical protein [Ramlibacter alkalitolerans]MBL0426592.1 hypothetical protein [Ramlibacter alkalitolerans]
MPILDQDEHDPTLPPPGRRWGAGAQSVLPYLTRSLQTRPFSAPEQVREQKPGADARSSDSPSAPAA